MCDLDGTQLDESITGHRFHCPKCDKHLTSLQLCGECGKRYAGGIMMEKQCKLVGLVYIEEEA